MVCVDKMSAEPIEGDEVFQGNFLKNRGNLRAGRRRIRCDPGETSSSAP